jgi:hypothetical protein
VRKAKRADRGIAGELDRFITTAEQRLGREGVAAAAAFTNGGPMTVQGAGKNDQAGLDALSDVWPGGRGSAALTANTRPIATHGRPNETERTEAGTAGGDDSSTDS